MLRIGVNALYMIPGGVGGTEIYLRSLLAALAEIDSVNEYFVFTNRETGGDLVPDKINFHHMPQAFNASSRPARILWEQTILSWRAARCRLDVLLNPGYTSPLICLTPSVTVFHDLQHKRHPEYFGRGELLFLRMLLWGSAHRSRKLIAVSESTRADLVKFYRIATSKVAVVPHGVDEAFHSLDGSREPLLLCVSTLREHKNLDRLIRAFGRTSLQQRLVIAGMFGSGSSGLRQLVADLHLQDRVELTGWISREQLLSLYSRAHAFVYPSLFEGFGIPVLEGMAAGIPVTCSDIPPLREIGGEAVLFFDPRDEAAITTALERICTDTELRAGLIPLGRQRSCSYTWQRAAETTLKVLTAAANKD